MKVNLKSDTIAVSHGFHGRYDVHGGPCIVEAKMVRCHRHMATHIKRRSRAALGPSAVEEHHTVVK
jgi:hypothetical protein